MNDGENVARVKATPRRGPSTWLLVVLFVSLALNFLIAGAAGTMLYMHYARRPTPWMARMLARHGNMEARRILAGRPGLLVRAAWSTIRTLPESRRRALVRRLAPHREQIRKAYADIARMRMELARLLAAEPFDEAAYARLMDRLRRADAMARRHVLEFIDEFVRALTSRERRTFARKLEKLASRIRVLRPPRG